MGNNGRAFAENDITPEGKLRNRSASFLRQRMGEAQLGLVDIPADEQPALRPSAMGRASSFVRPSSFWRKGSFSRGSRGGSRVQDYAPEETPANGGGGAHAAAAAAAAAAHAAATPAADDRDTEADGDDSGGDDDEEEEVVAEGDAAAEIGGGSSLGASVDLLASVDDGTTVVDVEMGGGERRDSTASIPDLE